MAEQRRNRNLEITTLETMVGRKFWVLEREGIEYGYRCGYSKDMVPLKYRQDDSDLTLQEKLGYSTAQDYYKSLKSLFVMHNDTFNIWSHLLYVIYLTYSVFYTLKDAGYTHEHRVVGFLA